MPKIKFSLSASSVASALERLEKYADRIENLGEEVSKTLTEEGVQQVKDMAMYLNAYDTGELVNGIVGNSSGNRGEILSTAPHSMYVEFGTGIRGEQAQHPEKAVVGWQYDINKHGDKGWFYLGDDGKYHWTKGMPARPFMYDSAQILRQSAPYIVEGLLSKE